MNFKFTIITILFIFGVVNVKAQKSSENYKSLSVPAQDKKNKYAILEFTIKNKLTNMPITSYFIKIGKIGSLINDEKGYSKFFIKKGKYNILVKAVGYNDKIKKGRKFLSNKTYNILIELDEKIEKMN